MSGAREGGNVASMTRGDALTDADAQYLADIWMDCQSCLSPGTELLEVLREPTDEGVKLVARYRLGMHDRESAANGATMLAAHSALRARIIIDRIRFGFSDLIEGR